jgi:hypothetical protein
MLAIVAVIGILPAPAPSTFVRQGDQEQRAYLRSDPCSGIEACALEKGSCAGATVPLPKS